MKKALIFRGGWEGHEPVQVSELLGDILCKNGIKVDIFDGVECLKDRDKLMEYSLVVPCITLGDAPEAYIDNLSYAVSQGVGLAGCHGMTSAFMCSPQWHFMTGGQWVAHPGNDGVTHTVNICHGANPIVEGISDFTLCSEQYYLHVDPAIEVLATTRFPVSDGYHCTNKPVDMPVVWTKFWGRGRVFYSSIGHTAALFKECPECEILIERGMLWAIDGKK